MAKSFLTGLLSLIGLLIGVIILIFVNKMVSIRLLKAGLPDGADWVLSFVIVMVIFAALRALWNRFVDDDDESTK